MYEHAHDRVRETDIARWISMIVHEGLRKKKQFRFVILRNMMNEVCWEIGDFD